MEISEVENIKQAKSILYRAHRVLVLTGAGVSVESGVPTFRGGGGAPIWRGMPFEQLSSAEMVEKDLPLVWEWFDYRRGKVSECEPNAAHETLAKVQQSDQFEEFIIVTQNIDGLHARAGAESVIELHGSLWRARCLNCKARKELREIPAEMRPPICDKCSNPMRPDVILFGEAIPMDAFAQAKFFAEVCDVCIVVGTSALVYPAAELPLIAKQMGAKVIEINPVETSLTAHADLSIRGKAAEIVPQIFVEKDTSDDRLPTSETDKKTAEQNRADYQTKSPNTELETESLPAENQPISQNEMTSESHPLRVDFVQSEEFPVLNRLGMTFAPGKKQKGAMNGDWNRNMYRDMLRLREHYEIDLQVSLLEYEEFNELGLDGFEGQSQRRRISLIKFPIRDVSVPTSMKNFAKVIREIVRQLNDGKKVVVHCKGGLGRTGLTAACTIVAASRNHINSAEAIKMVRQARPGAVETSQQENFVALFEEYWQIYSERIESLLHQQKTAVSEKILEIKSKGMIERLFRFPTYDGRYFFYLIVHYPHSPNNDNYDWKVEPVPTLQEALDLLSNHYQFVPYKTPFIHPEYRAEFKSFLEKIIKEFSGSFTFKQWLAGLDDPEERESNVEIDWSERPGELSDKHFLIYWQERNVRDHEASGYPLDVVSSRQLKRASAGDTLWLVTINQAGELILAGRLKIGEIVDYKTGIERLTDTSLWDGGFFALPKEDEAEYLRRINLGEAVLDLRFANSESDRLVLKNGKINPQQLQSMRELTEYSAGMLARIWETGEEENDDDHHAFYQVEYMRQLVRDHPLAAGAHYKLAFHCDQNDLPGEANAAYRRAIELAPDFLIAYERLGHNYLRAGELDKARQLFKAAVRLTPESADAHYNLGIACDENDLPEEANAAYQKAIELDPNYLGAYYNLGCNYLRAGELDESEQSFKTAIRLAPEFAPARFMLGVVYGGLGDFEKAISTTKEGLQYAPDDPMAYFNIGNFYSHLKDYKKASEWFEKSAEIDPNAPGTFYHLGKCYRESGEKEKEFDAYLNAVELAPDFVDAMFALGTVHAYLTETAEGRQVPYFETGGELILNDPRVSFYLGLGNLAFGNVDDARASIADLRKMDASLADQLQFFIDRFDSENKNADDILKDNIPNSAELLKEKRKSFKIKVGETIIEAQNTPELYRQVMTLLFDRGLLQDSHVPFATSSTRYLIAKEPVHPSGKNFFKFVEYAGFYMETNKSRHDAVSHLKKFVETLQVEFENLEDGIPIRVTPPVKKQNTQPTVEQRFLGSLLGLAVGDALGTTVEFKPTGTFPKVTTIIGGGPFELNAGEWTDDTSMALCLAESLIELNEFDAFDQMRRYCRWKNEGYLSSNGAAFDIGSTVRRALEKFEQQKGVDELNAFCGSISPATAGNGSLMRLAPVPLFFANEREKAIQYAGESSRTTHGARECVDACRYFAALIIGVIQGRPKEEILSARLTPLPGLWDVEPLAAKVAEVAEGSFKSPRPPEITGTIQGYVIPSLQAALWAFYHTDNFADGALKVVNLGYDADTYGAIYGQIAGAYYGAQLIPEEWLNLIAKRDLIESMAENLYKANEQRLITRN